MIKKTRFSTHLTLVQLVKKYQDRLTTQIFQKNGIFEGTPIKPILNDLRAQNECFYPAVYIIPYNNDAISHFAAFPTLFAIKSKVYFLTHQYLIIYYS